MLRPIKKILHLYGIGKKVNNNSFHKMGAKLISLELSKKPSRTEIINFLKMNLKKDATYLEIGVRFPEQNFNKISFPYKYGVVPGYENIENPVDFRLTSDEFFEQLRAGEILNPKFKFDVIFI